MATITGDKKTSQMQNGYPQAGNLIEMMNEQPLPILDPETVSCIQTSGDEPLKQTQTVLDTFNAALAAGNHAALASCFFSGQAYWRDTLALTYHLRTFMGADVAAASLLETLKLRGLAGPIELESVQFTAATPVLQWINCNLSFRTNSPAASCSGMMMLLPVKIDNTLTWKIWILGTRLEDLDLHPENEALLQSPGRQLDGVENIATDVFIVGGGNAAVTLAARLKTLGVDSIMAERNPRAGDNWALRYDCLTFHIPTSICEMPYMSYAKELQTPHLLTKDELGEQVRRYVAAFNLNIITSAKISSTQYHQSQERWTITFETPRGSRIAVAKHLVQATGISSQKPYIPAMADSDLYKGIIMHAQYYKNAMELVEKGVKSALVIGSANTAFDILEDCHDAGLKTTMVVRSPTYIMPMEYCFHHSGLGAYDIMPTDAADRSFMLPPTVVGSHIAVGLFRMLASQEPDRYAALAASGFPVYDSADPRGVLMSNLLEQGGKHYIDMGATNLLAEGKAAVKAGVSPVAYTKSGLRFSDGSEADADAVIWCTGFADRDVRAVAAEILGGGADANVEGQNEDDVWGPREIAARLDATWGVDEEGEVRGMWKRHLRLDDTYWVTGGFTQQHRWHSKTLALQIKAQLAGVLPPAYRITPGLRKE